MKKTNLKNILKRVLSPFGGQGVGLLILLLCTGCAHTKKNISSQKHSVDSITSIVTRNSNVLTIDSLFSNSRLQLTVNQRIIKYVPVEVDSGTVAPAGFVKLKSKTPGKEIILVPEITNIKATGQAEKATGSVSKKDSGNTYTKTETALKKTDQEKTRDVERKRFGNIWIYLILILVAAYLIKRFITHN